MKQTIAEQRNIEIVPGFSPKPLSSTEPVADDSPSDSDSDEPETHSPDAMTEGPIIQRRVTATAVSDVSIRNGIVAFGK
jgi:hypothetical protein